MKGNLYCCLHLALCGEFHERGFRYAATVIDQIGAWLDPTVSDPKQLRELLKAPPEDFLDCYAISRQINSVKFDEAEYNVRAQGNDQLEIHQP